MLTVLKLMQSLNCWFFFCPLSLSPGCSFIESQAVAHLATHTHLPLTRRLAFFSFDFENLPRHLNLFQIIVKQKMKATILSALALVATTTLASPVDIHAKDIRAILNPYPYLNDGPVLVPRAKTSTKKSTAKATATSKAASSGSTPATTGAASGGGSSGAGSGSVPASSGTSALPAAKTVAAGQTFDGGMVMFDRGTSCTGQSEGGDKDAVFQIENGGTLSNVIIGPNQIEGVHCQGACTLNNVWWSAVCEDAFTIKTQADGETTKITGGGAFGAEDKVLQHNGGGTLSVSGFTVGDFGKLYRSCGNCDEMPQRHVVLDNITARNGKQLAGVNSNYGDTAKITATKVSSVSDICVSYTGNDSGAEPKENGSGPSTSCQYAESDITQI